MHDDEKHPSDGLDLADLIALARRERGLTQRDMAERIGCGRRAYVDLEGANGRRANPTASMLLRIVADGLLPLEEIFPEILYADSLARKATKRLKARRRKAEPDPRPRAPKRAPAKDPNPKPTGDPS